MKKKSLFGLLAVFIAFSCMGLNCQKVTDPGSADYSFPYENQNFSSRAECVQWCQDTYRPQLLEENERYEAAVIDCGDNEECLDYEAKLHQGNVKGIQADRQQCIRSCHSQGTMGGGF